MEELRNHYLNSHQADTSNPIFKEYWESLQADQNFTSEKCSICDKRFVNATARRKHLLLRHFYQSTSSLNQGLLIKQIGTKFLELSIGHRQFSNRYDFKNPDNVIREFMDVSANLGSREGEFCLICCTVNQTLVQVEGKSLCTNSCFTTGIIQGRLDGKVKDYLFSNTKKRVLINGENGSNVFFYRFEFLKIHFLIYRSLVDIELENIRQ